MDIFCIETQFESVPWKIALQGLKYIEEIQFLSSILAVLLLWVQFVNWIFFLVFVISWNKKMASYLVYLGSRNKMSAYLVYPNHGTRRRAYLVNPRSRNKMAAYLVYPNQGTRWRPTWSTLIMEQEGGLPGLP